MSIFISIASYQDPLLVSTIFSAYNNAANKDELIDFSIRTGAPLEVVENLQEIEEEEGDVYESILEIWPDYPTDEDYLWNEDEYLSLIHI